MMKNLLRYLGGAIAAVLFFFNVPFYDGHTPIFEVRRALAATSPIFITSIGSIAQLTRSNWSNYPYLNVISYSAGNNKGGGLIYLNSADTTSATNSCTIFLDASGNRFYREMTGPITPYQCGAIGDGTTSDTAAMVAALNVGAFLNLPVDGLGGAFKITSGISADVCHTMLQSATLLAQTITSGNIVSATTTCPTVATMAGIHMQHPITGVHVIGPNSLTATSACFALVPITIGGTPWIPGVIIEHGSAEGCFEGVAFNNGAFNDIVRDMYLIAPISSGTFGPFFGIFVDGPTNSGEGIILDHLFIEPGSNSTGCAVWVSEAADVHLTNSSIDGSNCFLNADVNGAQIFAANDHFEQNSTADTNFMLIANSTDSKIRVTDSIFILDSLTRNFPIGISNVSGATPNTGGIFLSGNSFEFAVNSYPFDYLIAGPGPCSASTDTFTTGLSKTLTCLSNIFIRGPLFSSGIQDFTVIGTAPTAFASGGPNIPFGQTSASYIALNNTSGLVSLTSGKYACRPGQRAMLSFYESSTGLASSGTTFAYVIEFVDVLGNLIGGNGGTITTDSASFVKIQPNGQVPVPQGTASCFVLLSLGAPSSSNAVLNLTDVIFEAQ